MKASSIKKIKSLSTEGESADSSDKLGVEEEFSGRSSEGKATEDDGDGNKDKKEEEDDSHLDKLIKQVKRSGISKAKGNKNNNNNTKKKAAQPRKKK